MSSVALLPGGSLVVGAACAVASGVSPAIGWALPLLGVAAWVGWARRRHRLSAAALVVGFLLAGAALGAAARGRALDPPLREVLPDLSGEYAPVPTRLVLFEDGSRGGGGVTLRARTTAVWIDGAWVPAEGGVIVSVRGVEGLAGLDTWTAGRTLEMPVTFRRPTRYLNDGLPDAERALALDGTTLLGSVKSGLLVGVPVRGSPVTEAAARARRHVRGRVARLVGPHGAVSAGVVTAILIGDRTGLPVGVRDRLQAAGTYHVIAISGGNIAILVGLCLLALSLVGVSGRPAAVVTLGVLAVYVTIVTAEPSVWRATLMAGSTSARGWSTTGCRPGRALRWLPRWWSARSRSTYAPLGFSSPSAPRWRCSRSPVWSRP